jgi:hypothetical protein
MGKAQKEKTIKSKKKILKRSHKEKLRAAQGTRKKRKKKTKKIICSLRK